jgi:hypothetical protein
LQRIDYQLNIKLASSVYFDSTTYNPSIRSIIKNKFLVHDKKGVDTFPADFFGDFPNFNFKESAKSAGKCK